MTIENMTFWQIGSIAVAGALILAVVAVQYVNWTIRRDARKSPNDQELQAAVAAMGSSPVSGWLSIASYSALAGAALGILALGFEWTNVLQFAGVLFLLGIGTAIGFMARR